MDFRNFIAKYKDIFFYRQLEKGLLDCHSVLDVGCGVDSPIGRIKKSFYSEGIDIFRPSIQGSKKKKIHDQYRIGNIMKIDTFYKPKSFDGIIALDIIEHLEKKKALILIRKMEKIARKKIIILTPNGFQAQHHGDNPYEEHKSGWAVSELKRFGYRVYGLRGLKFIRGEWATIKYDPWIFWGLAAFLSEPLLHHFPTLSYHLLAVKNLNEEEN